MPPEPAREPLGLKLEIDLTSEQLDQLADRVVARIGTRGEGTPALLDADEAAKYLRCGTQRLYNLKSEGRIKYVKDGSRLLFRRADLDDYLEKSTAKATGEPNQRSGKMMAG